MPTSRKRKRLQRIAREVNKLEQVIRAQERARIQLLAAALDGDNTAKTLARHELRIGCSRVQAAKSGLLRVIESFLEEEDEYGQNPYGRQNID